MWFRSPFPRWLMMMSIFAKACIGGQFLSFVGLLIFVQFCYLGISVEFPGPSILPGQDAVSSVVSLGLASSFCPGHAPLSTQSKTEGAPCTIFSSRTGQLLLSAVLPTDCTGLCSDFDFCLPNPAGVSCPGWVTV